MQRVLAFVLLISFMGLSRSSVCDKKPDGFYEVSCQTMTKCTNGQTERIECPAGQLVDTDVHECKPKEDVKPPCSKVMDCSNMADGSYPDYDFACTSFYTCLGDQFLAHGFCPEGLVFNVKLQVCDWKSKVVKPCGTLCETQ